MKVVSNPSSWSAFVLLALAVPSAPAQSTLRVSVRHDGKQVNLGAAAGSISDDGRWVVMTDTDGLVPGDVNGCEDVILHDRWTGVNSVASVSSAGIPGDSTSYNPAISGDGSRIAFMSGATNLVPQTLYSGNDIVVRDQFAGTTVLASIDITGATGADSTCMDLNISANGRFVVWMSDAGNLVLGDSNGQQDIFVRDLALGTTERASVSTDGTESNGPSDFPDVSADGRWVVFVSAASNLVAGDTNGFRDVFLRDTSMGTTVRLTPSGAQQINQDCEESVISNDGRFVVFTSDATNLVPANTLPSHDVFRIDRTTGVFTWLNVGLGGADPDGAGYTLAISGDGRFASWESPATNLVVGDTNGSSDVFVRDCATDTTMRASVASNGAQGTNGGAGIPRLSFDGRFVAFGSSFVDLIAGDTNGWDDVFVRDTLSTFAPIEAYCTAKVNSLGCTPLISSSGEPQVSGPFDAFFLSASRVLNGKPGILIWSPTSAATAFGGGTLCLGAPIVRAPGQSAGGSTSGLDCTGAYTFHFGQVYLAAHGISGGQTLHAQFWSRDNGFAAPNNMGLTDALRFTTAP